ncbi:MAG: hypothetical protein L3J28_01290 [Candidatus Polarisedimenticolaceae bacterium]|nr:hypothetical protein [Candidatus Polarisedimenticolaceae bacterium]
MLNRIPKSIITAASVIFITLLTGCTSSLNIVNVQHVRLENIGSSSVRITRSYLSSTADEMVLRGELTRRIPARGSIPGHLHIELIGPDNGLIKTAEIDYKRKNRRSRYSHFSLSIPEILVAGSTLRIIHHDMRSHMDESPRSPWQDVDASK